jgi:transcriptional regulator with XRE-family HTH domain
MPSDDESAPPRRSFGEVLRDLLLAHGYTTAMGNADWSRFARDLGDVRYETLRKAVTKERAPSARLMERVAERLDVEPTVFWEYELARAKRALDPRLVGEEEAYANLQRWLGRQPPRSSNPPVPSRRRRRRAR